MRPVKLVLTRAQMFTSIGHRPNTIQQLSIGASRDGQLTAIQHVSKSPIGMADELINIITHGTAERIRVPQCVDPGDAGSAEHPDTWLDASARRSRRLVRHGVGHRRALVRAGHRSHRVAREEITRTWIRSLACRGRATRCLDCYRQGAERFGWAARNPKPRSMRNGGQLVGYGMARAALWAYQPPCKALASIRRDGTAFVRSGATDIGPGPYTVMTMLAADFLGVPIERVQFGLGDSDMPTAPQEGGSGLTRRARQRRSRGAASVWSAHS